MYSINVLGIPADPQRIAAEFDPADLDLGADLETPGKVRWDAEIYRLGEKVFVRGTVRAALKQSCSRCLNEFPLPLEVPVQLVALPALEAPVSAEPADDAEDGSILRYAQGQLDLGTELRSALLLALPMKPLCREDCPGLCPWCGTRLADGPHDCRKPPQTGPFSVLASWPKS